ncbi:MAG: putative quinol monooxygenase [Pseudomonadota bacterium]
MIIVLGSVVVGSGQMPKAMAISREHVERSRGEPGCIEHDVYPDPENPHRLVFVERWSDRAALAAHFQVPASRAFVQALGALAAEPPTLSIFAAEQISL